ncbi:MAG TPA: flagellin [Tepidisphaeraceae bacterium]|jgi:flagellin|nr:flagellin [Tepidisphaeraceae bacterium]
MSRINTNISSLQAVHSLTSNQNDLAMRLQRLSTGLQINTAADNPAGLIASESLRSEIAGINQALDNSQRAGNVINTAEGSLNEVSALLLQVQGLTNQAANSGALSPDEIAANQLQVDAILNSINRISNTTQFNGVKLLNGSLDYTTSSVNNADISGVTINAAKVPDNGNVNIAVQVLASAKLGQITFAASGIAATPTTIEIAGNLGTEQLSFAASAHNSAIAVAINQLRSSTGVSAVVQPGGSLKLNSIAYGSKDFISVKTVSGLFNVNVQKASGADAQVNINGNAASVDGLSASVRTGDLDINLNLSAAFGQNVSTGSTNFYITGGGARFQLGSEVNRNGQEQIGVSAISTGNLGDSVNGFLSSVASGGANSLVSGNTIQAQTILNAAISQIATLRGRLGAFQKDILDTNTSSLNVALENVTSSESDIRDTDFASETAAMTRAQILVQANTSILAQANSSPQSVLKLLG